MPSRVYAKDAFLHIIGELGVGFAIYKALEFAGTAMVRYAECLNFNLDFPSS